MNMTLERFYAVFAAVLLVGVLGIGAFMLTLGTKPAEVATVTPTTYQTAVITEMKAVSDNNFVRTTTLIPRSTERSTVVVTDAQLGKQDLAKPE